MSTCNLANPINELALESVDAKETITFAGPPKMIKVCTKMLAELGISPEQIS